MGFGKQGKDRFPFGKKERGQYQKGTELGIEKLQNSLERNVDWQFDSKLEGDNEIEKHRSFNATFEKVLPKKEKSIRRYIERTLEGKRGQAVGIEFGGLGSEVFGEFTRSFFKKTLGVALIDHRRDIGGSGYALVRDDKKHNHTVLEGDILQDEVYGDIDHWLQGQKADLIFERMLAGLFDNPTHDPYLMANTLQRWYSLMSEDSIAFIQVPRSLNPILPRWLDLLKGHAGALELEFSPGTYNNLPQTAGALRIRKSRGAPETLPMLDVREVRRISKEAGAL